MCTYSFLTAGTQHASMMPVRSAGSEDAKRFFIRAMINARTSIEIIVVYSFLADSFAPARAKSELRFTFPERRFSLFVLYEQREAPLFLFEADRSSKSFFLARQLACWRRGEPLRKNEKPSRVGKSGSLFSAFCNILNPEQKDGGGESPCRPLGAGGRFLNCFASGGI